ncbi:MAG: hypothetical protein U0Q16_11650 [Bryobacteraceae bacterium]
MGCYIASTDNRIYAALEPSYCTAGTASAANRIPAVKLNLSQTVERPRRQDKTGSRTFGGWPIGLRRRTTFDVTTYMAGWEPGTDAPCYGDLFRGALGRAGVVFNGGTAAAGSTAEQVTTAAAHGLVVGQAVRFLGELRFVAAIVSDTAVILNAPFSTTPAAGASFGKTITYLPSSTIPSISLFDYWTPAAAVQRIAVGAAVDRMRVRVNGDFHQFQFTGDAAALIDSRTFEDGQAGLTSFPDEPTVSGTNFSLVAGSLGQAWFGATPSQFHTVLSAEVTLENGLDLRSREFGELKPRCIVTGQRTVSLDMEIASDVQEQTLALYEAGATGSPISAMLQLGNSDLHLCGIYMPAVVPEPVDFVDDGARLQWRFRNSRAQGVHNDEISVAFG